MTTSHLKALIFDVDGTLADTERAHLAAFNHAFAEEGLDWRWDEALYTRLLNISGGKERLLHYWETTRSGMVDVSGSAVLETVQHLHDLKTAAYESMVNGGAVQLRPGVLNLMEEARSLGLAVAIATTTSPVNIGALLRRDMGPLWRLNFSVIGDASNAPIKKPHPQVYLKVLQGMKMPAQDCLAFEDSSNGLRAATAAGIATVITPTHFTAHHDFGAALRVLTELRGVRVRDLRAWHAERITAGVPA
jgi:beta-phosphoglucomutase-like phosphatase (HAD superfamily)